MIRKAILIGAPEAIKSKNFLEGVEIDLNHFEGWVRSANINHLICTKVYNCK
jgi:hypothetical protein